MIPIKCTLSISLVCSLLLASAHGETPETPDVLPGKAITVPFGEMHRTTGDLAYHTARDKDFYCFRNDHGFSGMNLEITASDLDFDDYIVVTVYDHDFNEIESMQFTSGMSDVIRVYPSKGFASYISFVDDGTMDWDGAYEMVISGLGGTDPVIKQLWGNLNLADKNYRKWKKKYDKLKRDRKKKRTKRGKRELKKSKNLYKKYRRQRESYRRQFLLR